MLHRLNVATQLPVLVNETSGERVMLRGSYTLMVLRAARRSWSLSELAVQEVL